MVSYKQADSLRELNQILALQQQNLTKNLNSQESQKEGFDTIITEVDCKNKRSLAAHVAAVGFKKLGRYYSNNRAWVIVIL